MRRIISAFVALGVLAGCDDNDDIVEPPTDPQTFEWEATMQGEEGFETVEGESSFTWTEGEDEFTATAEISGDEPGAVRPWHVHFNTCEEGGGIVGLDGDYDRLEVGADGTASATSTIPVEIEDPDASYHVNVHLSDDDLATIVACGDFQREDAPQTFEWEATMQAEEGFETVEGESSFTWTEGEDEFTATAEISGDEPGAVRPWHVHFNTCEEGGGIVGADGDYDRLEVGADGTASATSTIPVEIEDPDANYHVNVHLSDDDLATIVACGDFQRVDEHDEADA